MGEAQATVQKRDRRVDNIGHHGGHQETPQRHPGQVEQDQGQQEAQDDDHPLGGFRPPGLHQRSSHSQRCSGR